MRLIDADTIQYDQLLKTGNKEHPLEWAVSQSLINSMPTIKVEPKHGYWVNDNHLIKCSICGSPIPLNKVVLHGEVMWEDNRPVNYCPNCGAKMRAENVKD